MTIPSPAVANAAAIAPPSFLGLEWLVVINLTAATFGVLLFSYAARRTWANWRRDRTFIDPPGTAAELARRVIALFLTGATMRALSDALAVFGWDSVKGTAGVWSTAGRFLDPVGLVFMLAATVMWLMTESGLVGQLRVPPAYRPLWDDRATKRKIWKFAALAFALALCPVALR